MIIFTTANSGQILLWRHCSKNNEQWEGKKTKVYRTITTSDLNVSWLFLIQLFASIPHYLVRFSSWDSPKCMRPPSIMFPPCFWCVLFSLCLRNHLMSGVKTLCATHRGIYNEHKPYRCSGHHEPHPPTHDTHTFCPCAPKTLSYLPGVKIWIYSQFPLHRKKPQ